MDLEDKTNDSTSSDEIEWTLDRMESFIKALLRVSLYSEIEELKDQVMPEYVWKEVEQKLDIDYQKLRELWYHQLHMQLFCSQPMYYEAVKIKLIKILYGKRFRKTTKIDWKNIAAQIDGITIPYLEFIFDELIEMAISKTRSDNFKDQLKYLHNEYIPKLERNPDKTILPRLDYNNGHLSHVDQKLFINNNDNGENSVAEDDGEKDSLETETDHKEEDSIEEDGVEADDEKEDSTEEDDIKEYDKKKDDIKKDDIKKDDIKKHDIKKVT